MNQMFNDNCEACVHNQFVNNNLLRLARLEQMMTDMGSANDERLTDLEEALQVAYNRINKLEDYITGIEEDDQADTDSVCDICCECTCDEADQSEEASEADQAQSTDEFTNNDDFVPVSYYDDEDDEHIYVDVNNWDASETDDQVVPEMITVQFAGQDEMVQFRSAAYCQQVSSIPEDGYAVQAMSMCMMHEQDMRLNHDTYLYDTCYPVLCAEEEEEFPWNNPSLNNGDLTYGTCSDEYQSYYADRMASIHAAQEEDDTNDCAAFYQFKALDVEHNNGLDERIAEVLGYAQTNEYYAQVNCNDDDEDYYNEEYINQNYSHKAAAHKAAREERFAQQVQIFREYD